MLKKLLIGTIGVVLTFSMIACNNESYERLENKINVLTTYPDDVMSFISEQFKKETGIEVQYKIVTNDLEKNIKSETGTDFLLGGDKATYIKLVNSDVLKGFKTSWADKVNEDDKGENCEWYATTQNPIVLFYNKNHMVAQNAPKTWYDLSSRNYKNKIVSRNINDEYTKDLLCGMMYQYVKDGKNKEGLEFYNNFKNNIEKFVDDDDALFKEVQNKETPIGISTLSKYVKNIKENGNSLMIVNPPEGTPIIKDCAGILKNAKNPNASELFLEFVAGPKMQVDLAKNFGIIPTFNSAIKYGEEWMKDVSNMPSMNIDWKIIAENENDWINTFNNIQKQQTQPQSSIQQSQVKKEVSKKSDIDL